jgi:hypothetical protein
MNTSTIITTAEFLFGGALAYFLFSLLGFPLLCWLSRGRPPVQCGGVRFLFGVTTFATAVYCFEVCGLKIVYSAMLAIAVCLSFLALCPRKRAWGLMLATDDLQPSALLPAVSFSALTAFLFSKTGMQVYYHGWMYFAIERNIAFDLFPAINPGLLGATVEKSIGGFMMVGGAAGLLGIDAKSMDIFLKLSCVFALFSLSRAMMRHFQVSKLLTCNLGMVVFEGTAISAFFVLVFLHLGDGRAQELKGFLHTPDVLRNLMLPYGPGTMSNVETYGQMFHLADNLIGILLVCASLYIAILCTGRRRSMLLLAVLFWGACLIYSMYALQVGSIMAAAGWLSFLQHRGSLRRWFRVQTPILLAAGIVGACGLLFASGTQSAKTGQAALAAYGGTYLGIKALPHFANFMAPLGLLTPVLILAIPLCRWPVSRLTARYYWTMWAPVILLVLFLRTVGGNNYKFAFAIPFLALPMIARVIESLASLWKSRLVVWIFILAIYGSFALEVVLQARSEHANRTDSAILTSGSQYQEYFKQVSSASKWIRENTPRDAVVLIYPFSQPGAGSSTTENFFPAYSSQRRIFFIHDSIYVDPLPSAERTVRLAEQAYSNQPDTQIAALKQIARMGHVFAISTSEHPLDFAKFAGKPVFLEKDCVVYEFAPSP